MQFSTILAPERELNFNLANVKNFAYFCCRLLCIYIFKVSLTTIQMFIFKKQKFKEARVIIVAEHINMILSEVEWLNGGIGIGWIQSPLSQRIFLLWRILKLSCTSTGWRSHIWPQSRGLPTPAVDINECNTIIRPSHSWMEVL